LRNTFYLTFRYRARSDDQLLVVIEVEDLRREPDTHRVRLAQRAVDADLHASS
jgi:hypothetical protein